MTSYSARSDYSIPYEIRNNKPNISRLSEPNLILECTSLTKVVNRYQQIQNSNKASDSKPLSRSEKKKSLFKSIHDRMLYMHKLSSNRPSKSVTQNSKNLKKLSDRKGINTSNGIRIGKRKSADRRDQPSSRKHTKNVMNAGVSTQYILRKLFTY